MIPTADSSPTADAAAVPRSNFAFDFDVERKAVERAAAAKDDGSVDAAAAAGGAAAAPPSTSSSPSSWTPPDPWSPLFERHGDASREEVALAAALEGIGGGGRGGGETAGVEGAPGEIGETLEPLRQLTAMGFDPKQALGALVISNGDLAAATDACLAAAAASGARI